jgi:MAF protein
MFPQTHHVECVAFLSRSMSPAGPTPGGGFVSGGLTLASASPRRRELMEALGLDFTITPADLTEDTIPGESPQEMVQRLAREKAQAVSATMDSGLVIGADSTVVFEGRAVGKPGDDDEARLMLLQLRGTTHHVSTGLTVVDAASGRTLSDYMTSQITLRDITDEEIEHSIASGVPKDKAGAYAVQDTELRPAIDWQGCYNNIVGLPVCRLLEMLQELGYRMPPGWTAPSGIICGEECVIDRPDRDRTESEGDSP